MREVLRAAAFLTSVFLSTASAKAEDIYNLNQNQTGFNLPGVTLPQGQDEVRAADGTTCRSSVSGSGAYLDVGVIRGNGAANNEFASYGRVVIPIGRQAKRLNCERLYELEVQRLQMELKLLKMGLREGGPAGTAAEAGWADTGWSNNGTN